MKKPWLFVLLLFTGMLASFTTGFFIGRNANDQVIFVEKINTTTTTAPSTTAPITTDPPETTEEPTVSPAMTADGKIDLNLATMDDLVSLPGIGDGLAQLILKYRESHGPFTSVDELLNISGIGEKKLEALRDYVTVVP